MTRKLEYGQTIRYERPYLNYESLYTVPFSSLTYIVPRRAVVDDEI